MDESALERFFDKYIANDSSKVEKEVELTEEEELFLSLLPDELLTLCRQDDTGESRHKAEEERRSDVNSTSQDRNSQNPTGAAKVPGASPLLKLDGSSVTPAMPRIQTPGFVLQIENVIATVKLGCRLDLNLIAHRVWNVELKKRVLIMKIRKPQTTAMIYKAGHIVCTGARSEDQSRVATRRYARKIQKLGFPISFLNFKIQNLVASCSTFPVSLEQLYHHQRDCCSYEPELFPGLFYYVRPGITVTMFASGNMSLSGAKTSDELHEVLNAIYPILSCFRRQ